MPDLFLRCSADTADADAASRTVMSCARVRPALLSSLLLLFLTAHISADQPEPAAAATATSSPAAAQEPAVAEAPAVPAKPVAPLPPTPLELQPYRVRISVAFNDEPSLSSHFRHELLSELTAWLERTYAEMWQVTIEDNNWLAPTSIDGLARLTWSQVEAQLEDKELDKAFIVCVSSHGGALRLSGREWDRMTQQLSLRQERLVADRRAAADELGLVIRDLFHPIVMIEGLEGKDAKVRVKAGEFPPGDPSAEQLSNGAFFQPFFRFYNKQREVTQIQPVPWTYLAVASAERAHGLCVIHTGLRVTLGKNTKRSESWAIGTRASFPETRMRLTPHNNPTKPLTGYQVNVFEKRMVRPDAAAIEAAQKLAEKKAADSKGDASKPTDANAEPPKPAAALQPTQELVKLHELVTDRRGQVTVPVDPGSPLVWLYVSSGGNMLGRFPYMPGTSAAITAELPDDTLRLQLESRLELLRAELIDTIARRALLLARTKAAARAKEPDWARFDESFKELDRLPDAKFFHSQLDTIKVTTAKKAQDKKDQGLERKIAKLCGESAELIDRHLNVEKVKEQRDELVELRQADQEAAAAEKAGTRKPVPTRQPTAPPAQ